MMIETNESYHIGVCSSCLIKKCPNPKQNKNHPEQGCSDWTRYKKYSFPLFSDFSQQTNGETRAIISTEKLTEQFKLF